MYRVTYFKAIILLVCLIELAYGMEHVGPGSDASEVILHDEANKQRLYDVIIKGDYDSARQILKEIPKINELYFDKALTALGIALEVYRENPCDASLAIIKLLLDCGANPDKRKKQQNKSPLHYVMQNPRQKYPLISLLYRYGARVVHPRSCLYVFSIGWPGALVADLVREMPGRLALLASSRGLNILDKDYVKSALLLLNPLDEDPTFCINAECRRQC